MKRTKSLILSGVITLFICLLGTNDLSAQTNITIDQVSKQRPIIEADKDPTHTKKEGSKDNKSKASSKK